MVKEEIRTDKAPQAIGPYSQGVKIGRFLFLSGQIPIEPLTGEVVPGGIEDQTRKVLTNLKMVLEEGGGRLADVVKTTVYLKDLALFSDMNGIYGEFFTPPYPARATVGVRELPKGVDVEIDAVAVIGDEM
jgi:2-iminobutanoate/2-iminopropanoate deaminase